jgi:hypothetical protein
MPQAYLKAFIGIARHVWVCFQLGLHSYPMVFSSGNETACYGKQPFLSSVNHEITQAIFHSKLLDYQRVLIRFDELFQASQFLLLHHPIFMDLLWMVAKSCTSWWFIPWFIPLKFHHSPSVSSYSHPGAAYCSMVHRMVTIFFPASSATGGSCALPGFQDQGHRILLPLDVLDARQLLRWRCCCCWWWWW